MYLSLFFKSGLCALLLLSGLRLEAAKNPVAQQLRTLGKTMRLGGPLIRPQALSAAAESLQTYQKGKNLLMPTQCIEPTVPAVIRYLGENCAPDQMSDITSFKLGIKVAEAFATTGNIDAITPWADKLEQHERKLANDSSSKSRK